MPPQVVSSEQRRWVLPGRPAALAIVLAALLGSGCASGDAEPAAPGDDPGAAVPAASAGTAPETADSTSPDAEAGAGSQALTTPPAQPQAPPAARPQAPPVQPQQPPVQPQAPPVQPQAPPVQQQASQSSAARTFPPPEVWEALRQCESQGDYGFVHPSGDYFGAYQFTIATWDRLANQRYTSLLGVLPSEASPADQDRMAYYLWFESGQARWPACSHVFSGDPPAGTTEVSEAADPPEVADPSEVTDVVGMADVAETSGANGSAAVTEEAVGGEPFEPRLEDRLPPSPPPPATDTVTPTTTTAPPTTTTTTTAPPPTTTTTTTAPTSTNTPTEVDPSMQPAVPPDVSDFPTPEQWAALRSCESNGNYRAVSSNGLYYGAYQFWPDTWDYIAARSYPRLVGVLPSAATTHDQDRMAYRLWEERADEPWPVCGRHLRAGG